MQGPQGGAKVRRVNTQVKTPPVERVLREGLRGERLLVKIDTQASTQVKTPGANVRRVNTQSNAPLGGEGVKGGFKGGTTTTKN